MWKHLIKLNILGLIPIFEASAWIDLVPLHCLHLPLLKCNKAPLGVFHNICKGGKPDLTELFLQDIKTSST